MSLQKGDAVGKLRVFLSYHTPDRLVARGLADALAAHDLTLDVFFDRYDLRAGAFWIPALAQAISEADAVIVLLGACSPGPWQRLEYFEALNRKAKEPSFPIIPVLLPSATPRLPFLYQLHQLQLADPTAAGVLGPLVAALRGELAPAPDEPWRTVNPYRGLLVMTDADGDFFFGRAQLTADILARLRRGERMLTLVGNSGVGKSSVVQAGVVSALRRQLWPGGNGRDWPGDLKDSRSWLMLTMKPGEAPLFELARAFVAQWTEPTDPTRERLAAEWANNLQEALGLDALLRATNDQFRERFALPAPGRFVLVVDQAEELYTRADDAEARRFSAIVAAAAAHAPNLTVLASLRSDHYGHFQADEALFASATMVDVPPLREDGLRLVVERPPELLGARFEDVSMGERVVGETARQRGALPLLSYLLEDLWKGMQWRGDGVLRWSDYPVLVGVKGVLARRAEEFFETCRESDRAHLQRLFTLRLVYVPLEGEVAGRRAHREECTDAEWRLVEALAGPDWRLLVTGGVTNEAAAEVAHEVLLRDWERLGGWLEDERSFLAWKGELEGGRREWQRTRDEGTLLRGTRLIKAEDLLARRGDDLPAEDRAFVVASVQAREREQATQTRRRRWIIGGSLGAAAVMTVLALVSFGLWRLADWNLEVAYRINLSVAVGWAAAHPSDADRQRELAISHRMVGDVLKDQGLLSVTGGFLGRGRRLEDALANYRASLTIFERLAAAHPSDAGWQRELAISHRMVGDVLQAQGRLDDALAAYRASQTIFERLAASDPSNAGWQFDLSLSHMKLGDIAGKRGDRDGQRKEYGQARDILLRLAALDPSNETSALAWVEQQLKQIDRRAEVGAMELASKILFYLSIVLFLTSIVLFLTVALLGSKGKRSFPDGKSDGRT